MYTTFKTKTIVLFFFAGPPVSTSSNTPASQVYSSHAQTYTQNTQVRLFYLELMFLSKLLCPSLCHIYRLALSLLAVSVTHLVFFGYSECCIMN